MTVDAVGGVWEYALELCRGLAPHGVRVVLAVMGPAPDADQRARAELSNVELVVGPYRLEWMSDPWDEVAEAGGWLLELAHGHRCDLIHLNGYAHAVLPFAAPKLVVGHSCVASWWEAVKGEPAPPGWDRYRRAVRAGLQSADLVVSPTAWMLAELTDHYGPLPRTRVIPNGRRAEDFVARDKEPLVLGAGRLWDEAKNLSMLSRVAGRLAWPVVIAGAATAEGVSGDELGPASNTTLLGKLPPAQLAALAARASIFVSPARYEPFGLTALEAALCGCALVLSDLPSLRELWEGVAVFVPVGDEAAMARALSTLIDDPHLVAALGARAARHARRFGAAPFVERYLAAYRTLQGPLVATEGPSCAS